MAARLVPLEVGVSDLLVRSAMQLLCRDEFSQYVSETTHAFSSKQLNRKVDKSADKHEDRVCSRVISRQLAVGRDNCHSIEFQ